MCGSWLSIALTFMLCTNTSKPPFVCKIQLFLYHQTSWFRIITWLHSERILILAILPPFLQARDPCQGQSCLFIGGELSQRCVTSVNPTSFSTPVSPPNAFISPQAVPPVGKIGLEVSSWWEISPRIICAYGSQPM